MSDLMRWIQRETTHIFHWLNPASRKKAVLWENAGGVDFLRTIGVKEGDVVIDFGCGKGKFCIPAAQLVGADGRVYAVEKNIRVLKKVRRKANALGLQNLRTISSLTELGSRPKNRMFNMALLYDMLHFMNLSERRDIYAALHGVLAENGMLSIYPKHVKDDEPSRYFSTISAEEVACEVETSGFRLYRKLPVEIWHGHDTAGGVIWNFVKHSRKKEQKL